MAPLVETATARSKWHYVAFGHPHTIQLRHVRGDLIAIMPFIATALNEMLAPYVTAGRVAEDFLWTGSEFSKADENFFTPSAALPTQPVGTVDPTTISKMKHITYTKFSGRGGGRTTSFELFGVYWADDEPLEDAEDGIVTAAEDPATATAISEIAAVTPVTIANVVAIWKPYVNIKVSDYWRDQVKGS
jgi:hypothetical protein